MDLPEGDYTPTDFVILKTGLKEKLKKPIRKVLYPIITRISEPFIERKYKIKGIGGYNRIFLGHRGNDYEANRMRVNYFRKIKDSTVLIIGVGTGRDLDSWLKYKPKKIIAIDYFNYRNAWNERTKYFSKKYRTDLEFIQSDILDMGMIEDNCIDIIGSDAVFEHINQFDKAMPELYRILKNRGLLYATYGPLWYCWGGDHISGKNELVDGYNHINLSEDDYRKYLNGFKEFKHAEEDGRTWIENNLFSYLRPKEYLESLNKNGFNKVYTSAILEKRAIEYKKAFTKEFDILEEKFGFENLSVTGMSIIYRKSI